MDHWPLWEEIIVGWGLMTILPKLIVIPVFRWMRQAIRDTEAQDAIDAAWLSSLEHPEDPRGGGSDRSNSPRPPRPPAPVRLRLAKKKRPARRKPAVRA